MWIWIPGRVDKVVEFGYDWEIGGGGGEEKERELGYFVGVGLGVDGGFEVED